MDELWTDLISFLRERFSLDSRVEDVEAFLSSEGYDRQQIGEILSAFYSDIPVRSTGARPVVNHSMTFRVMGPHERGRFAPEAWGHLLSLSGSGLLNGVELEYVIERALAHFDGRIALDDLRTLIEGGGFDESASGSDHTTIH